VLDGTCRARLIEIARLAVEAEVRGGPPPVAPVEEVPLREPGAAFVTLRRRGRLRGCIGFIEAARPLHETVALCAASAAAEDPRFDPVGPDELADLQVEVSVLSPLRALADPEELRVGEHGLLVTQGPNRGLLLPQVAVEYGWDRQGFLEQACLKAGLPRDAWRRGAALQTFTAEVFGEPLPSEDPGSDVQ
jgi:AmmeMemoRadiSam system protein A